MEGEEEETRWRLNGLSSVSASASGLVDGEGEKMGVVYIWW